MDEEPSKTKGQAMDRRTGHKKNTLGGRGVTTDGHRISFRGDEML